MARYGNHGPSDERSVCWGDVQTAMAWMQRETSCFVQVHMGLGTPADCVQGMVITANLIPWSRGLVGDPCCQVTARWPCNQNKTLPGLVYRLLHQLDHMHTHIFGERPEDG